MPRAVKCRCCWSPHCTLPIFAGVSLFFHIAATPTWLHLLFLRAKKVIFTLLLAKYFLPLDIPSVLQCLNAQFSPLCFAFTWSSFGSPSFPPMFAPIPIPGRKQLLCQINQEILCCFTVPGDDSTGPTNLRVQLELLLTLFIILLIEMFLLFVAFEGPFFFWCHPVFSTFRAAAAKKIPPMTFRLKKIGWERKMWAADGWHE